jgi:hypothetical protein
MYLTVPEISVKQTRCFSRLQNDRCIQCQIDRERRNEQEGSGVILHGMRSGSDTESQAPIIQFKFMLPSKPCDFVSAPYADAFLLINLRC